MKKYIMINDIIIIGNHILHRIKALVDIPKYNVKAGDLGGYIEKEYNLSHEGNCWVANYGKIFDTARVYGNALVAGHAKVYNLAEVYGNAYISDLAEVYGAANIHGNVEILDKAKIYGHTNISGNVKVMNNAKVHAYIKAFGNIIISDNADISETSQIYENCVVYVDIKECRNSVFYKSVNSVRFINDILYHNPVYGYDLINTDTLV